MSRGVAFPEVQWPILLGKALGSGPLSADLVYAHAQTLRSVELEPGFGEFVEVCRDRRLILGIASNAQAYTLRELDHALGHAHAELFAPDLMFWSFQNGFSKPNPHVFQWVLARLAQRGIPADEVVMIGDRLDNDIEPARAAGMQTWHYHPVEGRGWLEFAKWIRTQLRSNEIDS